MNGPTPAHVDNDSNRDKGTKQPSLTVSDWVTFLANEKQSSLSTFLGFTALIVAALAITQSPSDKTWPQAVVTVVFGVACLAFAYLLYRPLNRSYNRAQKILKKVMSGELRQEEDIRKEWERGELKTEHKDKHWHAAGGASLAGAVWFAGWLFTIGYANLVWWKIIAGTVVWPYFLGVALR